MKIFRLLAIPAGAAFSSTPAVLNVVIERRLGGRLVTYSSVGSRHEGHGIARDRVV